MPAQLVALNDGPSILVDKPILLIGRHPECDIQIDSRKISRRHCCIAQVNDYLVVRDLDSTNGVRVNGVRLTEGRLKPGDELTIGSHRYRVSWEDTPAGHRPAPAARAVPVARAIDPDEDLALEECDEPVPLPEPPRPARAGAPQAQGPLPPAPPALPALPGRAKSDEDSFILPDNLELLPGSGSYPGNPAPPPG